MVGPKNPPKDTRFKPGQTGNPKGRPRLPIDVLNVEKLTQDELKRRISKHMRMQHDALDAVLASPDSIALDLVIAATLCTAIKTGDIAKAEYLFNRCLGKVKENMEVKLPAPIVINKTDGSQVVLDVEEQEIDG